MKAAGLPLRRRRSLDMPVAQSKLAHRPEVAAARQELPVKDPAQQPPGAPKRGDRFISMFLWNKPSGYVDSEHFLEDLALPVHHVKSKSYKDEKERYLDNDITDKESE